LIVANLILEMYDLLMLQIAVVVAVGVQKSHYHHEDKDGNSIGVLADEMPKVAYTLSQCSDR
jgi:hypothetical protein